MIDLPTTLETAVASTGEPRAGGTDLQERRALRLSTGPIVDLRDLPGFDQLTWRGHRLHVGALVTLAALAEHPDVRRFYPGVAASAGGLATPQIRNRATLGGNLLQHVRCWYYRRPGADCLRRGGAMCQARAGDHSHHACFDRGPCVAVGPSTMAAALLAYDATVEVSGAGEQTLAALYGRPSAARSHHDLPAGALLTGVLLPAPLAGERAAYLRATGRVRAEWPIVEVVARLVTLDGRVHGAHLSVGAVADVPLRLGAVEKALVGGPATPAAFEAAAALATEGANPLPGTAYKLELLRAVVLEALERTLSEEPVPPRDP